MRASYALALCAVLAACAADTGAHEESDMGSASDMGASFDMGTCAVVEVTPPSPYVPSTLTAIAHVMSGVAPTWTVKLPDGTLKSPTVLDTSGLIVSYDAVKAGSYQFTVSFPGGGPCSGSNSVLVRAPQSQLQPYRVRLTPPGSSKLPQQDSFITIFGNTPNLDQVLVLQEASPVGGVLHSATGPISGEVLLVPANGPETRIAVDGSGSFSLPVKLDASYRVVLVPEDTSLAPRLIGPLDGSQLIGLSFDVGPGQAISGVVHDELGAALPAARLALRAGPLPSGLGLTAADGSFALRAETGSYQLGVAASGWPELTLDGVAVAAGGLSITVDHALTRGAVALRVVRADGTTPVEGAKVTLRSLPLPAAGQIGLPGGPQPASGVVRATRTSLPDGTLGALSLPAATYDVLIEPPPSVSEGRTGLRLALSSGAVDLTLAPRVALLGQVHDPSGAAVAGARVRAVAPALTDARQATTGSDGSFMIALDAGVPVDLVVDPPLAAPLASRRVHLGAVDGSLGGPLPAAVTVNLEAGLPVAGVVLGPSGAPLAGVSLDVLCPSCGDPNALAHSESDGNGAYRLALPDPGLVVVDAGTD